MSCSSFTRFQDLAPEIRAEIWNLAIAAYVQDLNDNRIPSWLEEYDDYEVMGYEDLADCFPILAACREARELATAYFHRPRGPNGKRPLHYKYIPPHLAFADYHGSPPFFVPISELPPSSPPEGSSGGVAEREEDQQQHSAAIALSITGAQFRSPHQLVDVVSRHFNGRGTVERLVLKFSLHDYPRMALNGDAYWPSASHWFNLGDADPHPELESPIADEKYHHILEKYKPVVDLSIVDRVRPPPGAHPVMSISKNREMRVGTDQGGSRKDELSMHLLRLMDLVDASREKLPGLKRIDVNCEVVRGPLNATGESDQAELECLLEGDELFGWITRLDWE